MIEKDYVFYLTRTDFEPEENGFSIKYDNKVKKYDISSFIGFGDFAYYNGDIKTVTDLIKVIEAEIEKESIDEIGTPLCEIFDLLIGLKIQERGKRGFKTTYRR